MWQIDGGVMNCKPIASAKALLALVLTIALTLTSCSKSQSNPKTAGEQSATPSAAPWWKHAVFYELYPRSFADSDNNGLGDINGITSKLDYLKQLGVDAIWITPCYPSPQVDFGYDVSDYENIDPQYGTLADFDRLVSEGQKRGIRIIMDFVMNHTSDRHPWFVDSRSSKTAAKRDWYVWRDGNGPQQPPNNWISTFGGSAWKWDPTTTQFYYHYFYAEQPDLNWRNPAVKQAMFDTTRFWYKRGVAGFRLDAVDTLYEDPQLKDNPVKPGRNKYGDPVEEPVNNTKLPQVHDTLRELRGVADEYNAVLIGETWTDNIDELKAYYGGHGNELHMPMDFMFTEVNKLSPPEFRRQINAIESSGGWPVFVLSNHDIRRSYERYGDGIHNDQIAKLMAALYLTLRGTPIMYYGEELGMQNNDPKRKEDVKDPIGKRSWPKDKGRDGERTPMQWDHTANAGFSAAKSWLPVTPNYKTHNVADEDKDPDSILNFYRRLLTLRHQHPALLDGDYNGLNENDLNVIAYLRSAQGRNLIVALNMSDKPQSIQLNLGQVGIAPTSQLKPLITTDHPSNSQPIGGPLNLEPFGVLIAEVGQ
jgi:alpha-glucosidase